MLEENSEISCIRIQLLLAANKKFLFVAQRLIHVLTPAEVFYIETTNFVKEKLFPWIWGQFRAPVETWVVSGI